MTEQERFERDIKKIFDEIKEERQRRVETAILQARKYIESINDVEFNIRDAQIIVERQRSLIAYDRHIYALLSKVDYRIIYKSFGLNDVYQHFMDVELNIG